MTFFDVKSFHIYFPCITQMLAFWKADVGVLNDCIEKKPSANLITAAKYTAQFFKGSLFNIWNFPLRKKRRKASV